MSRPRVSADQAAVRLRELVARGLPQERLPPERVLAAMLGCSRETLRAALARLEKEGLVWRHVGQGTFSGPRPRHVPTPPLVLFEMATPADLMEARLVVEPPVAARAALVASAPDVARLRDLATQSCVATDWRQYETADDAFHQMLAHATGNHLLMAFLGMLSSVRHRARWQRQHDAVFRQARRQEYALRQGQMHLAIVAAIASGDAKGAFQAMEAHLRSIQELVALPGPPA